jgi:predicted SprT family Zn-dependent metalloprotease
MLVSAFGIWAFIAASHWLQRKALENRVSKRIVYVEAALEEIAQKAQIKEKVIVSIFYDYPYEASIRRRETGQLEIHLGTEIISFLSNNALRGVIAHELGHHMAGHVDFPRYAPRLRGMHQFVADSFAMELVGERSIRTMYAEVNMYSQEEIDLYIRLVRYMQICSALYPVFFSLPEVLEQKRPEK